MVQKMPGGFFSIVSWCVGWFFFSFFSLLREGCSVTGHDGDAGVVVARSQELGLLVN